MSQRGSIRRRGATWTAYYRARNAAGEEVQRTRGGFRTKGDAQAFLTATLGGIASGTYLEPIDRRITVAAYLVDHWLPTLDRRPGTLEGYRIAVQSWIVPLIGSERLLGLTPRHVEGMVSTLRERGGKRGQPLSPRSVQVAYTVLRAALESAVRRGYCQRNVAALVERPRSQSRSMTCWDAQQSAAFLRAAEGDRLYACWVIFLARGLRRGEVAGLKWANVDLDGGVLRIVATRISIGGRAVTSDPKTAAGRRSVPLDRGLVAVLRAHRRAQLEERLSWGEGWQDSGFAFTAESGAPVHPEHLSNRWESLVRRAGLPRLHLHEARHTAATLMLSDGTPVKVASELLGHSSPSITTNVYVHSLPGMAEAAGERLSARLLTNR